MNYEQQDALLNFINVLAFAIGLENLQENREQSRYNDVHEANDQQARYLLDEINRRFDEQIQILEEQNKRLDKILAKIDGVIEHWN